ncbi:dTDP-rhamnosyl transferase RfbF [Acidisarcina polymorpha]|uniref:dTDP-rhamnosyl transferase RfbF n=1 Tax=Acidisarcina polymorpha TaxID=2211140 RepID=A0A2Z5G2N0_9BACT|nr:glycosyltransferase family 2 protein [Acidisarcina polymorpha]AXC12937.1 dTDP-rhamnosyl transferase RfbF [Acidisarcina polymorpha]
MAKNGVCAIIISFRPPAVVPGNLAAARPQVEGLVVVDNGSSEQSLAPIRRLSEELDFHLIENGANLGIAAALNVGVKWAKAQGFKWVALFDQDSTMTDGFMTAMLHEYDIHPEKEKVAVITPKHMELETGKWRPPAFAVDGTPLIAITSGSVMPVHIFDHCGYFEEDLIIDRVDDEYCLRVRSYGYTLVLCRQAFLRHSVGTPTMHSLLGKKVRATNYGAKRRYYLTRNRVVMAKRYWRQYPRWAFWTMFAIGHDLVVNLLFEDHPWSKMITTFRGIFDALRGRMGKVVEL